MADSSEVDVEAVGAAEGVERADADNTDIVRRSGCERLCNSFVTAFCVAPLVILGMCFLLGWNERRAVCSERAIVHGKDEVFEVGCNDTYGSGELVMFSCDLQRDGLPTFTAAADFASVLTFQGVGLQTVAEIYQCVEHSKSQTRKDSVGGGSTTVTTYTYEKKWVSSPVDSSTFRKRNSESYRTNCGTGTENPTWPSAAPASTTQHAESGSIGRFLVPHASFLAKIPLDDPLLADSTPAGWSRSVDGFEHTLFSNYTNDLGSVRVRFFGNNWDEIAMTVLGLDSSNKIERWTAPDSWLCSDFQLGELRVGEHSKDDLFTALELESDALTWILRCVAVVFMWMGFCCIFKPLEVAADCVPWLPRLCGDKIACVIGCVTCPATCACSMGVAGAVWVVMRPALGIGLLSGFCCIYGCYITVTACNRRASGGGEPQQAARRDVESDSQPRAPSAEQLGAQPEASPDSQPHAQQDVAPDAQSDASPTAGVWCHMQMC